MQLEPSHKIFVGNMSYDVTHDDLLAHFSPCGSVIEVHIMTEKNSGRPKGCAVLTFTTEESVSLAVSMRHGQEFQGREIRVMKYGEDETGTPQNLSYGAGGAQRPVGSNSSSRAHPYAQPVVHSPKSHTQAASLVNMQQHMQMQQPARPTPPMTPLPVLPAPWTQHVDPVTRRAYFFNPSTGESYWARLLLEPT
eukprot:CAMPEP_0119327296 /NCGR_PEP_ID=MMETSP1333-20130426/70437_1 /TAXON_ID=418940 /ORGANISM="Scyphosphaera apsteinii, Strain RCC1455" /LENGTH=193 /DNA_ID=CAMNT_0007335853 /DNA_START=42 /DNA_END=623 /DNA_ORIENTATION=-